MLQNDIAWKAVEELTTVPHPGMDGRRKKLEDPSCLPLPSPYIQLGSLSLMNE